MRTGKQQAEAIESALRAIRRHCKERDYVGVTNDIIRTHCERFQVNEQHLRRVAGIAKVCRK